MINLNYLLNMKKTILKGWHRPIGLPAFLCPIGHLGEEKKKSIKRKVVFQDSCRYDLKNENQYDWNKLFGVCFSILGIHMDSVRFGWRYNLQKGIIEICIIIYKDGLVQRLQVAEIDIDKEIDLEISIERVNNQIEVFFFVENLHVGGIVLAPSSVWYFGCGFYFGGDERAPHKISAKFN